ncbi:MAG: aminotransferase class V-fold PLP-dependent enzyme [Flammeovirgaceae bacterium]|jgi:isopenicillin-N epimerase|nr:aminotransferase class V-fold PLP-dependent enzyme [Flammeovirgaceae bacterium]NQW27276.1 aminotransferase class V-fold PLP-dependent enzyme [Flammeovirgaceae bacterium]|tara:strand:- start:13416 stop:14693 length:1278 start_codon:yes stop_codon:yes gene_type:complete
MTSRRLFLKKGIIGGLAAPLLTQDSPAIPSISNLQEKNINDAEYWQAVRKHFVLREDQVYFNNGTMGPTPGYVINKISEHLLHYNVHAAETDYKDGTGPELLTGYFSYDSIRQKIGLIINADYQSIALTQNATFGMNYVANGLALEAGDEIINTNQEHGGGYGAWMSLAKRHGLVYKQAQIPIPANDPEALFDAIFKLVTKKTKVIAIPHIVSVYGTVMPVKAICAEARKRGIFTVLDGAQSVGQVLVDVQDIGCDAYYSSLHKWLLAPAGNGILYINPERIGEIWTTIASYNWDNQTDHGFRLMQNGTGNPALMAGLDASLDFYNTIGQDRWISRIKTLGDYLRNRLQAMDRITIHSSTHPQMCAGLTTYALDGWTGPDLQKAMWAQEKLQPRSVGTELLRHSVHIYNNESEIDRAIDVMNGLK